MAVLDFKKATLRLCDGRLATLTTTAANGVNAQITLTDKSKHRGTRAPITITLVDPPGNDVPIDVVVTGTDIVVTLATDGSSAITTTASQLKAAIEADVDANALVTVTLPGTGAAVVSAQAETPLANGARNVEIKLFEGNLQWTETSDREYVLDRGTLDIVKDADEQPVDAKFDIVWEYIKASTGSGTPTFIDVVDKVGEASAWVTTSDDPCAPYCIDVEIEYEPACSGVQNEFMMFEEFYYEQIDFNYKDGTFSIAGKSNRTEVQVYREAA